MVLAMPNSRRAVYIGSLGADVHGLEGADGPELLRSLLDHTQQCGSYTHAWVPGDVVVMDNRRIMHSASGKDYPDHDRLLVRVQSVASDEMMRPITGGSATGAKL
jgi:taurine dioxygenase